MKIKELEKKILENKNLEKAKLLSRFFKTNKGEYGEGDFFLGITVPVQKKIVKEFKELDLNSLQELLNSKFHEKRSISLLILIEQFKKADDNKKKEIYEFYLKNSKKINNWDLVDLTAPNIIGKYLLDKPRDILYKLAESENLWERRIAILSTFSFIRQNDFNDCLNISKILLNDSHDLIHKAVGWMLREIGKRDRRILENFLIYNYKKMPRTMLRYAIEKFPELKRKKFLKGEV
ncbi:MAG: DNA alkylation repair protein [Candidatus Pacearchaeota archaeon]